MALNKLTKSTSHDLLKSKIKRVIAFSKLRGTRTKCKQIQDVLDTV